MQILIMDSCLRSNDIEHVLRIPDPDVSKYKMEHLRELEEALHTNEVSSNREKLAQLLHPNFIEIGYSGATHTFQSMMEVLNLETPEERRIWSQDYKYIHLGPDIVQVLYRSARADDADHLSRHARRMSIWIKNENGWQMHYHQATPTEAFEKLET